MKPARRRRWRWWWLLPLLLLGLPGLAAWWLLDPTVVESLLRQAIRQNAALELQTDTPVQLVVFPAPRLVLRDIRLTDSQGRELARAGGIDADLPWHSLWRRPPELGRIALRDVELRGGQALDDWLALLQTGPPSPTLSWPQLEGGVSIRRLRYFTAPPPHEAGSAADGDSEQSEPVAAADDSPALELAHLDLEPLRSGGPLQLDLAVLGSGYRLGLRLNGRAEDASGSLRVAAAALELAFGPLDNDEALRGNGQLDISYLPAGGIRGELGLQIEQARWLATQVGLDLDGPWQISLRASGEADYQTLLEASVEGDGIAGRASWPLDGSSQPSLALDLSTRDGLRIEGLQLERMAADSEGSAADAR